MLTINAHDVIRETFAGFHQKHIKTRYSVGGMDKRLDVTELLFSNFELPNAKEGR